MKQFTASSSSCLASYPSLKDQGVLVTGGATGIGASLVQAFVEQGARVAYIDIALDAGRTLAEHLRGAHHPPCFVAGDLRDVGSLQQAVTEARQHIGHIGVLLNNAANDRRCSIAHTSASVWDDSLAINIRHQFFTAQAVAPDMQARGAGSIINFGSVSWKLAQAGMPAYAASKAAVHGLTRGLARDLGAFGIRVNTLVPGWVMTERQLRDHVDDRAREEIAKGQCLKQALLPEHVARLALFLASEDSAMCTAQEFVVDGGWV